MMLALASGHQCHLGSAVAHFHHPPANIGAFPVDCFDDRSEVA